MVLGLLEIGFKLGDLSGLMLHIEWIVLLDFLTLEKNLPVGGSEKVADHKEGFEPYE